MKKLFVLLSALLLSLFLSACTDPAADSDSLSEAESDMRIETEESSGEGGIVNEGEDTAEGYGDFVGFH